MKKLLCLVGGAMLILYSFGQNKVSLKVGDTIPNMLLSNIVNYQEDSVWLYDINKPIILDFFATYCGTCIQLLPHLNKIRDDNSDSLSVFIIAGELPGVINKFLDINPNVKGLTLPFISNDTILNNLFSHRNLPHEVWIGKDHVIKAITGYRYVTQENIKKFIEGRGMDLPVKNDFLKYDAQEPLHSFARGSKFYFSSELRGYTTNLPNMIGKSILLKDSLNKKVIYLNNSLLNILRDVVGFKNISGRFQLLVKDSSRIIPPKVSTIANHWSFKNSYCYEIIFPRDAPDSVIRNYILQDLGNALNFKIQFVKKNIPCLLLVKHGDAVKDLTTKGGRKITNFYPKKGGKIMMRNSSIAHLVMAMEADALKRGVPPIIDETGITTNVDIDLNVDNVKNINKVNAALATYGLGIEKAVRSINVLLISDL